MLYGHTSSCLLSPTTELPTGVTRHSSGHLACPHIGQLWAGMLVLPPSPSRGWETGRCLLRIHLFLPTILQVPPNCLEANCCRIWLFQSQLNLERDLLTTGVTCAAQRNETHSQRLRGTKINVQQQDLPAKLPQGAAASLEHVISRVTLIKPAILWSTTDPTGPQEKD